MQVAHFNTDAILQDTIVMVVHGRIMEISVSGELGLLMG